MNSGDLVIIKSALTHQAILLILLCIVLSIYLLTWVLLCRLGWPRTLYALRSKAGLELSAVLPLHPSAGVIRVYHHMWLGSVFYISQMDGNSGRHEGIYLRFT